MTTLGKVVAGTHSLPDFSLKEKVGESWRENLLFVEKLISYKRFGSESDIWCQWQVWTLMYCS